MGVGGERGGEGGRVWEERETGGRVGVGGERGGEGGRVWEERERGGREGVGGERDGREGGCGRGERRGGKGESELKAPKGRAKHLALERMELIFGEQNKQFNVSRRTLRYVQCGSVGHNNIEQFRIQTTSLGGLALLAIIRATLIRIHHM